MRKIIEIPYVEDKVAKDGRKYSVSHVILEDGEQAEGFGRDFKVGDKCEVFFHWGKVKVRKPKWDLSLDS